MAVGPERFRCPEALFRPALVGLESPGIHEAAFSSVMRCDAAVRRDLLANVVLAGGTAMLPGLADRVQKELAALAPPAVAVCVVAPPGRGHSAWAGGASLAARATFRQMLILREEYEDAGPAIVHSKCL
jgi:actin